MTTGCYPLPVSFDIVVTALRSDTVRAHGREKARQTKQIGVDSRTGSLEDPPNPVQGGSGA
jgi:hypothetical protein